MAKKIGHIVRAIEFSDEEKNRLGDSLRNGVGTPYETLLRYAPQIKEPDFWQRAQRKFRVTGFREGHPSAKQMVIKRALDTLKNTSGSDNDEIWPLYRFTIVTYVSDELEKLNRLLSAEDFDDSNGSGTEQIFRAIKQKMPIYGFSNDDLIKLYEIWGFDRTDKFNSILADHSLDIEVIRRLIASESEIVKKFVSDQIDFQKSIFEQKIKALEKRILEIAEETESVGNSSSSSIAILRTEFQNIAADLLTKKVSEMQQTLKKSIEKITPNQKSPVDFDAMVLFENRLDKITKRIQAIDEKILSVSHGNDQAQINHKAIQPKENVSEISQKWTTLCKGMGIPEKALKALPLIIQALTRTKVVIAWQPQLIIELFKLAGSDVKTVCVSPLWINKKELDNELRSLSKSSANPHILVISDFDVALQEVYLVPFLVDWLQSNSSNVSKVILVPSTSNIGRINPRILELGWLFDWLQFLEQITQFNADECLLKFEKSPLSGENGSALFRHKFSTNLSFESDLAKIGFNEGVILPPSLMSQFMNVHIGLMDILSYGDSGKAALSLCLVPWLKRTRGEAVCRIFEERIRAVFGGI